MKEILNKLSKTFITFREQGYYFVFDGEQGKLLKVSEIIYYILYYLSLYNLDSDLEYKEFIKRLELKYGKKETEKALKSIKELNMKGYFIENDVVYEAYKKEFYLPEKESYKGGLWLNISHACNLDCTYCYANGGDYGLNKQLMNEKTAQKCIDYWYNNIDKNKKSFDVIFFGGEPLYNQKVFFYVIDHVNEIVEKLGATVRYTMATNGTIINNKIIDTIKNNNFNLSISNDGMEHIHNRNRPYKSGKDSYTDVIKNIIKFQEINDNLIVNMVIVKNDIPYMEESVKDLWNKGIKNINVSLCMDKDQKLEYEDLKKWEEQIKNLADITYDNMINGEEKYLSNIYESIMGLGNKMELGKCSLFNNGVFIFAPNGDVYKCHRNVGNQEYKIANIYDEDLNLLKYRTKKTSIDKCKKCWAKTLCDDGCPYEHQLYNNNPAVPAQILCDKTKIIQKEVIRILAKLSIYKKNLRKDD